MGEITTTLFIGGAIKKCAKNISKPTRPTIKIECHLRILFSIPNGVAYVLFEHLCILGF